MAKGRSAAQPVRVLLVEDTPEHAMIVRETLAEENRGRRGPSAFQVAHVARLDAALRALAESGVDVVLLDLHVPDSHGLDTFHAVRAAAPDVPVVVTSAHDDEALATAAVRAGAQDYLVKGEMVVLVLARALRYAIERKRAEQALVREQAARAEVEAELRQARLAERRRRERQEREIRSLERLAAPGTTVVTAQSFGVEPLSKTVPHRFTELVERYAGLLDLALEERAYKVEHRLPDALRALADELGFLNAGPRDVVELHTTALKQKVVAARRDKAQALVDEARVLVLQLMGYLVAAYRG